MVRLNRARCEALLDELTFVAERLKGDLAVATAQLVTGYVAARLRTPGWHGHITFDGE